MWPRYGVHLLSDFVEQAQLVRANGKQIQMGTTRYIDDFCLSAKLLQVAYQPGARHRLHKRYLQFLRSRGYALCIARARALQKVGQIVVVVPVMHYVPIHCTLNRPIAHLSWREKHRSIGTLVL